MTTWSKSPTETRTRTCSRQLQRIAASLLPLAVITSLFFPPSTCVSLQLTEAPTPKAWPHQFHSLLFVNYSGSLSQIDLWYDWPNGRNFNIIRDQLSSSAEILYDLEWNNGTSFLYTLQDGEKPKHCRILDVGFGILRPNWLDGANYLGQRYVDGFLCNVWEKVEFIWYYEDVVTKRPVHWVFYTGRSIHVMTFEVGAVLEDEHWQAPAYCFDKKDFQGDSSYNSEAKQLAHNTFFELPPREGAHAHS